MRSEANLPPSPDFPNLGLENHQVTSPRTPRYNCIAWAAEDDRRWWWPDPDQFDQWPGSAPRLETIPAFIAAFGTLGYEPCTDGNLEPGYAKIALDALADRPTHAARQLPDGRWSSKMGKSVDLAHDLDALDGPLYGRATTFLRRANDARVGS